MPTPYGERWDADNIGNFDVVVANDLLPNVDQRLSLFLERYLPVTRRLRLSLTYYPQPRFYRTRRIESDELLCMLAWDGNLTARALEPHLGRIDDGDLALLTRPATSLYANGRLVCLVDLRGDL